MCDGCEEAADNTIYDREFSIVNQAVKKCKY